MSTWSDSVEQLKPLSLTWRWSPSCPHMLYLSVQIYSFYRYIIQIVLEPTLMASFEFKYFLKILPPNTILFLSTQALQLQYVKLDGGHNLAHIRGYIPWFVSTSFYSKFLSNPDIAWWFISVLTVRAAILLNYPKVRGNLNPCLLTKSSCLGRATLNSYSAGMVTWWIIGRMQD